MINLKEIEKQVSKVITHSQGIPEPKVKDILQEWLDAKLDFIEAWDGNPIYELPEKVAFHLSPEEREQSFNDFIDLVACTFHAWDLSDFLIANKKTFFENKVEHNYEYGNEIIPSGMKLIKAFKYFEQGKTLDTLQTKASQLIQEDKVEGRLCFSVHPLDYLSSSLNTYNWRSCHALDGEYRAGNFSYMLDKSTVVCYLKGEDNVQIPLFPYDVPWNSKKWRTLLFMSKQWQMIFAGKQYPFKSQAGLELVRQEFIKSLKQYLYDWDKWSNEYIDSVGDKELIEKYFYYKGSLKTIEDTVKDVGRPLHYNDVLRSTTYTRPYYSIKRNHSWLWNSKCSFEIGKEVKCLQCGIDYIEESETMRCPACELKYGTEDTETFTTCACCGNRMYRDSAIFVYTAEEYICESCFENECFVCDSCNEIHYLNNQVYDKLNDEYICKYCYEERRENY